MSEEAKTKKKKVQKERYDNLIDKKKHPFQWFAQVFWYRNWIFIVAAVLVSVLISYMVYQSMNRERYDMRFIIAIYDQPMSITNAEIIRDQIAEVVPDVDGNGKVSVAFDLLYLGDDSSVEINEAYWRKLLTSFSDENYIMYIVDKRIADLYSGNENGETPFDTTCIEMYTGEESLYLSMDSAECLQDTVFLGEENGLFIAFRPKPQSIRADESIFYADYVKVLEHLLPDLAGDGVKE
ncbi:MAG: hypothetical protein IKZ21_04735 [Clostridia bacterium]|nr:hypothetical protein [Clostridia bacterium]